MFKVKITKKLDEKTVLTGRKFKSYLYTYKILNDKEGQLTIENVESKGKGKISKEHLFRVWKGRSLTWLE